MAKKPSSFRDYMYSRSAMGAPSDTLRKNPIYPGLSAPNPQLKTPDKPKYVPVAERIKATSERFKREPNYNLKDIVKRNKPGDQASIERDVKNLQSRFHEMYKSGSISRNQFRDSIQSTMDLGSRKLANAKVKSLGVKTKAGKALQKVGNALTPGKKAKGGEAMKAECRSRNCNKPGLDSKKKK